MRKMMLIIALIWPGFVVAEQVVIAAFGDSLTQGFGLPVEDGFVPQMQRWLDDHGTDVRLINAGVSGDTTAGARARVAWTLTPDVHAMIVAIGGNDMLRGLEPDAARQNIAGILQVAHDADIAVLLVGMQAQGNFGQTYKQAFEALYPELASEFGVDYAPSFFVGLMQNGVLPPLPELMGYLQSDGLHPNADGVAQIVEGLGPYVVTLAQRAKE